MTLSGNTIRRGALAAGLGAALLTSAIPGLANDKLADFSVDGSSAVWMPIAKRDDRMVLKLFTSPENEQVCCDEPVGPDGVSVDLNKFGEGSFKYELYLVPFGAGKSALAPGQNRGPDDENGRPVDVSQTKGQTRGRGQVQSGFFTYPVDPLAEEKDGI